MAKELKRQDALRSAAKAKLDANNLEQQGVKLARLRCALTQTRKAELEAKRLEQEALGLVTLEAELHVSKLEREEALRLAARKAEIQAKREALGRAYVRIGQRHNKLELFRLQTANVRKTNCTQAELERVHDGTHPGSLEKPPQEGKRSQTLRPAPAACTNRNTIPTG